MYSWTTDTSAWKNPGAYSYDDALKPYLEKNVKTPAAAEDRTYVNAKTPDLKLVDPKDRDISTQSADPVVVVVDTTGSMKKRPAEIFDRLPLLNMTLAQYRPNVEFCFAGVGDAKYDKWPMQVNNFGKGSDLEKALKAICPEGRGGPGIRESYEMLAYYMLKHSATPSAQDPSRKPFMFIMGDEKFYDLVDPDLVERYFGDTLQAPLQSMDVWHQLGKRYDIFFLRRPYEGHDEEIVKQWSAALGPQRVIDVEDDQRVVDVAMGIVATSWGEQKDFYKSLSARQDTGGKEVVQKSLRAADITPKSLKKLPAAKSLKLIE